MNILDAHLGKIPTRKGRYVSVQNRFKRLLSDPAKDRPVLDAVASTAESVADIAIKDELLAAVPFVSTAFKVVKAMDSTRDRLFAAKLRAFIAEVETLNLTERMELSRKLTADDGGRKAGETLLLVLDKITDMDKPALLGLLLKRFGSGRITATALRRLATGVDLAISDDLAEFFNEAQKALVFRSTSPHREALVMTGFTRVLSGDTIDSVATIYYGVTDLGVLIHQLVNEPDGGGVN